MYTDSGLWIAASLDLFFVGVAACALRLEVAVSGGKGGSSSFRLGLGCTIHCWALFRAVSDFLKIFHHGL